MTVIRTRFAAMAAILLLAAIGSAREARAAAEVHRFNVVFSANPTSIAAGEVNDHLGVFNRDVLSARGLKGMDNISFGWFYQIEARYFVTQNVAVSAGFGQLKSQSKREFLPAISEDIQLRLEMISVPIHVGGAFYLPPYNQGDFQARAYLGAGFMSLVHNRLTFQREEVGTDASTTLGGSSVLVATADSPGYYGEFGVHMFFPSRFSVMVGALYRSGKVRDVVGNMDVAGGAVPLDIVTLDTGGLGVRMGVVAGF